MSRRSARAPRAIAAYRAAADVTGALSRWHGHDACARPLPRAMASRPSTLSAVRALTNCCNFWPMPICGPAMRRSIRSMVFWSIPSPSAANGAKAVVAPERDQRADVDAMLARVTATHPHGVSRQSQQSDRHLSALQRGEAPACRLAEHLCCWCSMRPMPNMCGATTMRPASNWSRHFDNVVMTRTFSKIYGLAALRLGWAYCPAHVADVLEPHPRALQCQRSGAGGRRRRNRRSGFRRDGHRPQ